MLCNGAPCIVLNKELYMSSDLDWVWELLARGYAEGESLGAFNLFDRSDVKVRQSEVLVLCGLVLGQRVAFNQAKQARQKLYKWLTDNCDTPALKDITDLFGNDMGSIVWIYARENAQLSALNTRSFRRWSTIYLPTSAADRIVNIAKQSVKTDDLRKLVEFPELGTGIGKWTQKAFEIICFGQNHLLYEDLWIRKRWSEFCERNRLTATLAKQGIRTLKQIILKQTAIEKHLSLRQLSLLLWRITPTGIRSLTNKIPLTYACFVPHPRKYERVLVHV